MKNAGLGTSDVVLTLRSDVGSNEAVTGEADQDKAEVRLATVVDEPRAVAEASGVHVEAQSLLDA